MRKVVSVIMSFILFTMALTGCNSTGANDKTVNEEASNNIQAKGRYVEEDIELPSDVSNIVSLVVSPEGNIELYAYGDNNNFMKYLYIDKKWEKDELDASIKAIPTDSIQIDKVFYGEDKRLYVLVTLYPDIINELHRLSDSGELEKIDMKRFNDVNEEWDNLHYLPYAIDALENGTLVASYYWSDIELYSPDGQTITGEFDCGNPPTMMAYGNSLYFVGVKQSEIIRVDTENNEEQTFAPFEFEISDKAIIRYDGNTSYICDTSGIHLYKDGSSIWETVVDGERSSLGTPSQTIVDFLLGTEDDYYLVLYGMEKRYIKHIFYDDNVNISPKAELTIFSIEDSYTIRQALNMFRNSHPDISINFRVANINREKRYMYGIKDPDATVTLQEQINALNTELLADKGADIIVLDGLPIDSYIEKGVLEDMGDLFNPMIENDEFLSNIADNYNYDGKVYTMPVRIHVPFIYGSSEAVEAAESLKDLATYAENSNDIPLFDPSNYRSMTAWLLLLYYDQILNDSNEIDQALLLEFFKNTSIIADDIGASVDFEMIMSNSSYDGVTFGYWITASTNVHRKFIKAGITEAKGFYDLIYPLEATKQWNGTFSAINNTYRANTLVGINSAGKNKECAKEFVQFLFSEEVQSQDLNDGFPVNKLAMEKLVEIDADYKIGTFKDLYEFWGYYPTLESRNLIYEEIKALEGPMENDSTMIDMILDEAERYLRGDISVEQAVDNVLGSINTYLLE